MADKHYTQAAKAVRLILYAFIAAGAVLSPALEAGKPLAAPVIVAALVAAANAIRSYIDQSGAPKESGS